VAAAPPAPQFNPEPTDWERRGEVGLLRGYFGTWKRELFSPDPFWRSVRPDGSLWDAISFGWITSLVYALPAALVSWGQVQLQTQSAFGNPGLEGPLREFVQLSRDPRWLFGSMAATLVFYPATFLISAAIFHVLCLIFGAGKNGFTATARVFGYASAPMLVGWVPCLGPIVAGLYSLVLQIWGLTRIHRTDVWRPIVAYVVLILLSVCCACGIVFAAIGAADGFK
jgi:hypothetical protein